MLNIKEATDDGMNMPELTIIECIECSIGI
jgi:hypothetical protein